MKKHERLIDIINAESEEHAKQMVYWKCGGSVDIIEVRVFE